MSASKEFMIENELNLTVEKAKKADGKQLPSYSSVVPGEKIKEFLENKIFDSFLCIRLILLVDFFKFEG
jgi:hypothetical protein